MFKEIISKKHRIFIWTIVIILVVGGGLLTYVYITGVDLESVPVVNSFISKKGTIVVNSDPVGAKIFLDDEDTEKTTINTLKVKEGKYTIKLTKDGYKDYIKKVEVKKGEEVEIFAILEEGKGTSEEVEVASNIFDLDTAKEGDKVAGMVLVSIQSYSSKYNPQNSQPLSINDVTAEFSGRVTVTGSYDYTAEGEPSMMGEFIRFDITDSDFLAKLPQIKDDDMPVWFGFTNMSFAKEALGLGNKGTTGTATIIIDNYTINRYPSEVFNSAALIEVIGE